MEKFYQNQTVFLTGATGFVGKVLLHQLLKMQVRKVILLIRRKRNKSVQERLESLLAEMSPTSTAGLSPRVSAFEGDITENLLGIDIHHMVAIQNEVTVVIHSAACTRFDLPLSCAVRSNVFGTFELLRLSGKIRQLRALVYVSTAYSECAHRGRIEERVTTLNDDEAKRILQLLDTDPSQLDSLELKGHPNTYTLSKFYAESLIKYSTLPVAIVRPPTIVGALQSPRPGWVDNFNTYNGLAAQPDFGFSLPLLMDSAVDLNIAPVDVVANVTLAAGWRCGTALEGQGVVYNCTDSNSAPSVVQLADKTIATLEARPVKPACYCRIKWTSNPHWRFAIVLFLFLIPAIIVDIWATLTGKPRGRFAKVRQAFRRVSVFDFFTTTNFDFAYGNVRLLSRALPADERKRFPIDVSLVNWNSLIPELALGVARHVEAFKEAHNMK